MEKKDYDSISTTIFEATENFPLLIKDYEILDTKSDFTDLFTKLTEAANPNNELILGKSYTTFIKEEASNLLLKDLNGETKNGFLSILNKIISNPIVGSIINSNPVGSLVTQVINSASNFVSQKIDGCNLCEKTLKYTESIKQDRIKEFSNKIQPFVVYYDKILAADRSVSQKLEVYKVILKENRKEASEKNIKLRSTILNPTKPGVSLTIQVNSLLNVNNSNYRDIIDNDQVKKAYELSKTYKFYKNTFSRYNQEFSKIFSVYLNLYYQALSDLKSYASANNYDSTRIEELQSMIKIFINKHATVNLSTEITNPGQNKIKSIKIKL
ncbi:hypothetical protein [Chryseobacterium camelliae]|uniref:hypothetical protein n=1 Tax=Chryseobacterium camelliae TaxID=1265445 RepID=UPI000C1C8BF7|nr:hypothetical protein [Chryseobacterium camelliae]